jgi:phosphotransferase system HPr (HPr) family protein
MTERAVVTSAALHARPASTLAAAAGKFASEIELSHAGRAGNAKSVLSLLALDVPAGEVVVLRATGPDADDALAALAALVEAPGHDDA